MTNRKSYTILLLLAACLLTALCVGCASAALPGGAPSDAPGSTPFSEAASSGAASSSAGEPAPSSAPPPSGGTQPGIAGEEYQIPYSYPDAAHPGGTALGGSDFTLPRFSTQTGYDPGFVALTVAQQERVAAQLMEVVRKYQQGEYPVSVPEATDAYDFYAEWPAGVPYPAAVSAADLVFTTVSHEMYDMSVFLPLGQGWALESLLALDIEKNAGWDATSPDAEWLAFNSDFWGPSGRQI